VADPILAIDAQTMTIPSALPANSIRSILVHIQNDTSVHRRLEASLELARATGAHLKCIHITPIEAYVTMETWGGLFGMGKAIDKIDAQEASLRTEIEHKLRAEDVSWDYEHVTGYAVPEIVRRAAFADLAVTGREAHGARAQRPEMGILGDVLTHVRTPLFIPGSGDERIDPLAAAIIAWNGSFEAANAARAAIGLLAFAREVRVVRYTEDKQTLFPDTGLIEYLSRHAIHAELDVRAARLDFADDLIEYANLYGASYIVMGGYSHSRASELVFGGVTRALLHDCPIPLLMSH
jgi:nucleotide-binding universal stress UspA family protein